MKKGFSTLFTVIILGSTALALAIFISTTSFWSIQDGIDSKITEQTKALANACAEVALYRIRELNSFSGTSSVNLNGEECEYNVINNGGSDRTILITATIKNITRNIELNSSGFNPPIINSWVEN